MQTIRSGGLTTKDPNSSEVFHFDWDNEHLYSTALISSSSFFISGTDAVLTKDNEGIGPSNLLLDNGTTLHANRYTQLRLIAGTLGVKYTVTNRIVTNEAIPQTKDASFKVLIQER
jgi:hypothetical protein